MKDYTSYSKFIQCNGEFFFAPSTVREVSLVIGEAKRLGKKVKAIGSLHSNNDIICGDIFVLSMKELNKIIKIDHEEMLVTVQSGYY